MWGYFITTGISALIVIGAYFTGKQQVQKEWDQDKDRQSLIILNEKERANHEREISIQSYEAKLRALQNKRVQPKEIVSYISHIADSRCSVNNGFVSLFNSTITSDNSLREATNQSNAETSSITLSTVASVAIENFERCKANTEQLIELQSFINRMCPIK